jgi:N-methylhydantoinase A
VCARFRITSDTGGTFVDVALSDGDGQLVIGKAPTTASGFAGVRAALEQIGEQLGLDVGAVLADTAVFITSTTRATNAIIEQKTAMTALLVTEGFPDILVLREGGKKGMFNHWVPYPDPYVPRALTFEVPERVDAFGNVVTSLDENAVRQLARHLAEIGIEAIAVCLLFAHIAPRHELLVKDILSEELPDVPVTVSHSVNPIVGEFRRASSAAIDASLKPLMRRYLQQFALDLRAAGFRGELLAATSLGGVVPVDELGDRPLHSVRSGPSLAPVAGLSYANMERDSLTADHIIVCDAGGTSFDVSLARDRKVAYTTETWLGPEYLGHLTGASSVDVRSIGAGGGSIAWVDSGGRLRVGPESAGATPGPACYGRGGDAPTVTDAACVLGFLDPEAFLGGRMRLDAVAAERVVSELGGRLGLSAQETAASIMAIFNDHMVGAIHAITIDQGLDPRDAEIVAGGGAAGLGVAALCRELGCESALIPRAAGALSAVGGQFSELTTEFAVSHFARTSDFDRDAVNAIASRLEQQARGFAAPFEDRLTAERSVLTVTARYVHQNWSLEIESPVDRFDSSEDVKRLADAFHGEHYRVRAVTQPEATVECLTWKLRWYGRYGQTGHLPAGTTGEVSQVAHPRVRRQAFFDAGAVETDVYSGPRLPIGARITGPAIIEEPATTVVVPPYAGLWVTDRGNFLMELRPRV